LLAIIHDFDIEPIKFLCDKNADINAKNAEGKTPLSLSLELKKIKIMRHLLERNAKIENPDAAMSELLKPNLNLDEDLQYIISHLLQKGANKSMALAAASQVNKPGV